MAFIEASEPCRLPNGVRTALTMTGIWCGSATPAINKRSHGTRNCIGLSYQDIFMNFKRIHEIET